MGFKDRIVFVTGGTRGLGRAMGEAFLDEGAKVAVSGRKGEAAKVFEEAFAGKGGKAFVADIGDYGAMEAVAEKVVAEWGGEEDFDRVIDVNLKGTFYATQIFGRKMIELGSGRIVFRLLPDGPLRGKGVPALRIDQGRHPVDDQKIAFEWGNSA